MGDQEQLTRQFYTCFQKRDWQGMAACYGADIFFYDPVFGDLIGEQASGMWEMLLQGAKDLRVSFDNIRMDENYGVCDWTAEYTFSQTGRPVVNKVRAHFKFEGGKIVEHQDVFDLWKWSRQALGLPGILLGWSSFFQRKIRNKARASLDKFLTNRTQHVQST